jgi:hypothetical protein
MTRRIPAILSSSFPNRLDISQDPYDIATQLLDLVVELRAEDVNDTFDAWIQRRTRSYQSKRQESQRQIERLIEQLQQYGRPTSRRGWLGVPGNTPPPHRYDIMESLLASGFFCTLYWYVPGGNPKTTPTPLWEQVSLKASNIKGQQYYERNDFQEAVINYSEIWGRSLYLTAEGTFQPIDSLLENNNNTPNTNPPPKRNTLSCTVKNSRTLRTCPDVFRVEATKVTLHILGLKLPLPIQGSSNLVILYADPRIRIFVSPIESKSVVGNWEEAGLVVVQVRSDLFRDNYIMTAEAEEDASILRDLR